MKRSVIVLICGMSCLVTVRAYLCAQETPQFDYQALQRVTMVFASLKAENRLASLKRNDVGGDVSFYPISTDMCREPFLPSNIVNEIKCYTNAYLGDVAWSNKKVKIVMLLTSSNVVVKSEYKFEKEKWVKVSGGTMGVP